jgi:hypothetical protein
VDTLRTASLTRHGRTKPGGLKVSSSNIPNLVWKILPWGRCKTKKQTTTNACGEKGGTSYLESQGLASAGKDKSETRD